jgi:hypothetical protein
MKGLDLRTICALATIFSAALPAAAQEAPRLSFPAACALGKTCFIQNYVDREDGPGAKDFRCGPLTYDGHKGTDIALPDRAAMARGVPVLAAAPGRVRNIRDGMTDVSIRDSSAADVSTRECGNGVVIVHQGGWETQYCHMRNGSIAVRPGQDVLTGAPLGLIGLSGQTEFPHLHFQLSHLGAIIDPFDGGVMNQAPVAACAMPSADLWMNGVVYAPGGVATAGFAAESPRRETATTDGYAGSALARTAFLSFWVEAYGVRQGDLNRLTVTGPDGAVTLRGALKPSPRTQARQFHAIGRAAPPNGWAPGTYRGEYQLLRDGRVIAQVARTATIP